MSTRRVWGFPKNIFYLGWVSLLNDASSEMIYPLIPVFLTQVLKAGAISVGMVEGIAETTAALSRFFSGVLADRLNRRKTFVVAGYSLSAISKPLLALATLPVHVVFVRLFDRLGKGLRESPRDVLLSVSSNKTQEGRSFGYHRMMDTAGAAIGPILAFLILRFITPNLRHLFLFSFVASVLAVGVLVKRVREVEINHSLRMPPFRFQKLHPKFKIFLLAVVIFSLGRFSEVFLILRAQELGMAIILLPLVYFLFNFSYATFSLPAGLISDKIGRRFLIIGGWILSALVFWGFGMTESTQFIWLLFVLFGLSFALSEGIARALTADVVREEYRGTAYGILSMAIGITLLPANLIAGFIWQTLGADLAFLWGSLLSLTAVLVLIYSYTISD